MWKVRGALCPGQGWCPVKRSAGNPTANGTGGTEKGQGVRKGRDRTRDRAGGPDRAPDTVSENPAALMPVGT